MLLLLAAQAGQPGMEENAPSEAVVTLTIVGRCDPLPEGGGEEIVVCGRRDRTERYRLPIRPQGFDPKGPVESVSRERHRLIQEGDIGIGSCSTIGPGGYTGCFHRDTKRRCQQEGCGVAF
jgi:hypothetical protein